MLVKKFGYTSTVYSVKLPKLQGEGKKLFPETVQFRAHLSARWNKGCHVPLNYGEPCPLKTGLTATAYFTESSNWRSLKPMTS